MRKKILVADDSITIQKVIEMAFAGSEYDIVCAGDGKEAEEKFSQLSPDIVLADIIMPEMDGYSLCTAIKSKPESSRVPVLLLSGAFEPFDREKAESSRADGVITKPFKSKTLIETVEKILNPPPEPPEQQGERSVKVEIAESPVEAESTGEQEVEDFPVNLDDAIDISDPSIRELFEARTERAADKVASEVPTDSSGELARTEPVETEVPPQSEVPGLHLTDQEIEAVAKKLMGMISSSPIKDAIREAISEIAEKIIRERIRELEEKISE